MYTHRLARAVEADNNDGKLVLSESQSISISTGKYEVRAYRKPGQVFMEALEEMVHRCAGRMTYTTTMNFSVGASVPQASCVRPSWVTSISIMPSGSPRFSS